MGSTGGGTVDMVELRELGAAPPSSRRDEGSIIVEYRPEGLQSSLEHLPWGGMMVRHAWAEVGARRRGRPHTRAVGRAEPARGGGHGQCSGQRRRPRVGRLGELRVLGEGSSPTVELPDESDEGAEERPRVSGKAVTSERSPELPDLPGSPAAGPLR